MRIRARILLFAVCLTPAMSATVQQQPQGQSPAATAAKSATPPAAPAQIVPPSDYVIGPEDKLGILFWRDEAMSAEVTVRPDGKISLPLLNDVHVAGLTPESLRVQLLATAKTFVAEPSVSVVVREINSRKVFITGQVARPGAYPLTSPTTVLQLIAIAGGLGEFADPKKITIIRPGQKEPIKFNYDDVRKGKNLQQNVLLKIGDTVVVPG